tara:strand:+ start:314 stop:790 length:477 start_codon:yes stop_codon:yes gene_type:complete
MMDIERMQSNASNSLQSDCNFTCGRYDTVADDREEAQVQAAIKVVLVVDDNEESAQTMADMLERDGYQVRIAYDVAQTLTIIKTNLFDAAVLDIGLPDGTGFELAEQIRQLGWGRHARLIAHTGWSTPEDQQRSMDAGFDHHLAKPLDYAALLALLQA